MTDRLVTVSWYNCDCAETYWITKYCDEHHRVWATVPASVLEEYIWTEQQ